MNAVAYGRKRRYAAGETSKNKLGLQLTFTKAMDATIAAAVAVIGWLATYWLTVRANRRLFLDNIIDSARIEIVTAIRECQRWLSRVNAAILVPPFFPTGSDVSSLERRIQVQSDLSALLFSAAEASHWTFRLEEYQILLPYTAQARHDLLTRQQQIRDHLQEVFRTYTSVTRDPDLVPSEQFGPVLQLVADQIALLEDLRIHLQNRTLHKITGNQVPARRPPDPTLPRLIEDDKGNLRAVSASLVWPRP